MMEEGIWVKEGKLHQDGRTKEGFRMKEDSRNLYLDMKGNRQVKCGKETSSG